MAFFLVKMQAKSIPERRIHRASPGWPWFVLYANLLLVVGYVCQRGLPPIDEWLLNRGPTILGLFLPFAIWHQGHRLEIAEGEITYWAIPSGWKVFRLADLSDVSLAPRKGGSRLLETIVLIAKDGAELRINAVVFSDVAVADLIDTIAQVPPERGLLAPVIDAIAESPQGTVLLAINDDFPWQALAMHMRYLRRKIDAYMEFLSNGRMKEKFPDLAGRPVEIRVYCSYPPTNPAREALRVLEEELRERAIVFTIKSSE